LVDFLAAHGLQGLQPFLAAHGLQGLQAAAFFFLAAQGLHGLHAPQPFLAEHGLQLASSIISEVDEPDAACASGRTLIAPTPVRAAMLTALMVFLNMWFASKLNRLKFYE
jgi:hypothetical protein